MVFIRNRLVENLIEIKQTKPIKVSYFMTLVIQWMQFQMFDVALNGVQKQLEPRVLTPVRPSGKRTSFYFCINLYNVLLLTVNRWLSTMDCCCWRPRQQCTFTLSQIAANQTQNEQYQLVQFFLSGGLCTTNLICLQGFAFP